MSPVSRLKKTWSKVKTAKFDILEVSVHERFIVFAESCTCHMKFSKCEFNFVL